MASRASLLAQALLYKFRYFLGYGFLAALLVVVMLLDLGSVPNGLTRAEMNQAITSTTTQFSWDFDMVVNAPYSMLQQLSVEVLGLNQFSLIVPSLVFGILTIILFMLSMRHWFRDSVAVVASALVATSAAFIGMSRSALPDIMLPFWTILLIYAGMRFLIARDRALPWKLLMVLALLGLLYTPFGVYPAITIVVSSLFHPHVRSRLRHTRRLVVILLASIFVTCLVPLILSSMHHATIVQLLGIEQLTTGLGDYRHTLATLYHTYFDVTHSGYLGSFVTPVFNVVSLVLTVLGLLKSIKDKHMARSYILLSWVVVTVVLLLLDPLLVHVVILPGALLAAIGVETIIDEWYSLFPRNPYARMAGLIPLSILFIGVISGNILHYFNNQRYVQSPVYNSSLPAIHDALKREGDRPVLLVAKANQVAFYKILGDKYPNVTVTAVLPKTIEVPTLVLPPIEPHFSAPPSRILTSSLADDAVSLRIYRP